VGRVVRIGVLVTFGVPVDADWAAIVDFASSVRRAIAANRTSLSLGLAMQADVTKVNRINSQLGLGKIRIIELPPGFYSKPNFTTTPELVTDVREVCFLSFLHLLHHQT
jgi:hypothetical protein